MEKLITWTEFSDEMPKEDNWYVFAMKDSIPMFGYLREEKDRNIYIFEYYRCDAKCTVYFDEQNHDGLIAWTLAKDLY